MPLEKNNAGLIVIGASDFPESNNFIQETAFTEAKHRITGYFTEQDGPALDKTLILDLFDSELDINHMDKAIASFIGELKQKNIPDLFIYYVGHGGFTPNDDSFYLATRLTRDDNPELSSIIFKSLSGTITRKAYNMRTFIILDCCFAASAGGEFMADPTEAAGRQIKDSFPAKGVALLCAASKDRPARIVRERNITMFSDGLDQALRNGDASISDKYLSLRQIHYLTYSYIKKRNPGQEVRPEVSSPFQPLGDIADMPQFFNYGFAKAKKDIVAKKIEIEEEMVRNNHTVVSRLLIDFIRNFDLEEKFYEESILIGGDCFDLEEDKINALRENASAQSKEEYRSRRRAVYSLILEMLRAILKQKPNQD